MHCPMRHTKAGRVIEQTYYLCGQDLQQLMAVLEQLLNVVPLVDPRRTVVCKVLNC